MKKLFSLLFTLCLSITSLWAIEKEIVLKTKTGDIHGTILTPDQNARKGVIALFICGSGPTDRNGNNPQMKNNSILYLAEDLCSAGIASVRYDKRAIAKSAAAAVSEADLRFGMYVDDAKEWINLLSKEYSKIILIGHSEGALIGTIASVGNPKVAGLISLAGTGHTADEILKIQLASQPKSFTDVAFPIIDSIKKGEMVENIPASMNTLFRKSVQPYMISWFAIDPTKEIAKVKCPVLIIQGDKDMQVSVEDAELLHKAQPKAKKVIIANMNHVLKECHSMDQASQMPTYTNPLIKNMSQLGFTITNFFNTLK